MNITYKDREYGLEFNLNVMGQIQDEYGSLDEWGKLTEPEDGEPNIKALVFGVMCMVNEAIDISNEDNGTNEPPMTKKQVGRMLTEVGLENVASAAKATVIEATEDDSKNA